MKAASNEDYYQSYDLDFRCLDEEDVLKLANDRLSDHNCKNMVVDFGQDNAYVGWDIDENHVGAVKESWKNVDKAMKANEPK
ncbi:hypothetical protein ABW20_dc0105415 [Dactylellina cionopaga]|nr:hypothetical protein ABW20_dc0105415 [Dactylellina cionopaga]